VFREPFFSGGFCSPRIVSRLPCFGANFTDFFTNDTKNTATSATKVNVSR